MPKTIDANAVWKMIELDAHCCNCEHYYTIKEGRKEIFCCRLLGNSDDYENTLAVVEYDEDGNVIKFSRMDNYPETCPFRRRGKIEITLNMDFDDGKYRIRIVGKDTNNVVCDEKYVMDRIKGIHDIARRIEGIKINKLDLNEFDIETDDFNSLMTMLISMAIHMSITNYIELVRTSLTLETILNDFVQYLPIPDRVCKLFRKMEYDDGEYCLRLNPFEAGYLTGIIYKRVKLYSDFASIPILKKLIDIKEEMEKMSGVRRYYDGNTVILEDRYGNKVVREIYEFEKIFIDELWSDRNAEKGGE